MVSDKIRSIRTKYFHLKENIKKKNNKKIKTSFREMSKGQYQRTEPAQESVKLTDQLNTGLPLSGRTTYITPWDCHRTSKLNFKDVPRTSEISFVRPKSIPETSKNCQKARPLLTSCMMFAPPTYRKFATCVDWASRTSHFPLVGVLLTAVSRHPFDGCVITACICHACWVD